MEGKNMEKAASLLTLPVALASCSVTPIQNPDIQEPIPLTEPLPTEETISDIDSSQDTLPQPTIVPELRRQELIHSYPIDAHEEEPIKEERYIISLKDGKISTEEIEDDGIFNEEILDIFNWVEYGMEVKEVKRNLTPKTVEITQPTTILTADLSDNGFVMKGTYSFLEKSTATAGKLEILDEKIITSEEGNSVVLGILPYEGKVKKIQAIIIEATDSDGTKQEYVKEIEDLDEEDTEILEISSEKHSIDEDILKLTRYIYNPEDLTRVKEYIEFNPTIESILSLKEALDEYPGNSKILLPQYLRETKWYQDMVDKVGEELMEKVIQIPTSVSIANQPIQCVAFDKMAKHIYPELNIPDVKTPNKGYAKEIAPYISSYNGQIHTLQLWYDAKQISGPKMPVNTYEPGDVFVTKEGEFGHTGVIVGKYTDNQGEPFLLVADSNRTFNGRIKLFVVDKYNIGSMLGTDYMYIIRSDYS